jgi:adenine deaminase
MFIDPHEIANVFGLRGVRMMHDEAMLQPIHVWVEVPSCVPSSPGLETPGAVLGPAEIAEALSWPGVIGLGEMMNFHGVLQDGSGRQDHRRSLSLPGSGTRVPCVCRGRCGRRSRRHAAGGCGCARSTGDESHAAARLRLV